MSLTWLFKQFYSNCTSCSNLYFYLDEVYAAQCLEHARDLWEFALSYQGSYSDHIETGDKYKVNHLFKHLNMHEHI